MSLAVRLVGSARRSERSRPMPRRDLAHLSDEAVVALTARSDEVALAELYDRYGRAAYGLALRILRDEALAEDAVQEAFLAVWRGAGRFIPEKAKASTWIMTLVHRRAVDLVRGGERRRADPLPETEPSSGGPSAADSAWLRLERERVQAALAQLPDAQREALELAYYGGFTQSELAERLGGPLGPIKSRVVAGLAPLREVVGAPPDGGPRAPRGSPACALDALDEAERRAYEAHLAGCERCRAEVAAFSSTAEALAYAVGPAGPPPMLRDRILVAARDERPNVVPVRPRWVYPVAAVAAVAACAASGLPASIASLPTPPSSGQPLQSLPL